MKNNVAEKRKYKILLIDDDTFISDMYALKFGNAGHNLVVANSADEALALLRTGNDYDAIATDLIMPEKDGFDFLRAGHEENLFSDSVIIVLSNQDGPDVQSTFKELGAKEQIVKAHTLPNEVLKLVECAIEKHKYNHEDPLCEKLKYM